MLRIINNQEHLDTLRKTLFLGKFSEMCWENWIHVFFPENKFWKSFGWQSPSFGGIKAQVYLKILGRWLWGKQIASLFKVISLKKSPSRVFTWEPFKFKNLSLISHFSSIFDFFLLFRFFFRSLSFSFLCFFSFSSSFDVSLLCFFLSLVYVQRLSLYVPFLFRS